MDVPGTIEDIRALACSWDRGVLRRWLVIEHARLCGDEHYLLSTGVAVEFEVVNTWRDPYFAGRQL